MTQPPHRLEGLEPDNLLAFLALLGTMRGLEAAALRPRVAWDGEPLRPVLRCDPALSPDDLALRLARGCRTLGADCDFGGREALDYTTTELLELSRLADGEPMETWLRRQAVLAPLAHMAAPRPVADPDGAVEGSPLNCLDVARTKFLKTLAEAARMDGDEAALAAQLHAALFARWRRADRFVTFRWDPAEDRRHAYRAVAPTTEPVRTEAGAVRLAALGLAALPGVAVLRRGARRFGVLGVRTDPGGQTEMRWPVWTPPLSLTAVQALLGCIGATTGDAGASARAGVIGWFRSRRVTSGRFGNFTRAEFHPTPARAL